LRSEQLKKYYDHRDRSGHQQQEPLLLEEGGKLTIERFHRHFRNHIALISKGVPELLSIDLQSITSYQHEIISRFCLFFPKMG
jgi:hypothetical protein